MSDCLVNSNFRASRKHDPFLLSDRSAGKVLACLANNEDKSQKAWLSTLAPTSQTSKWLPSCGQSWIVVMCCLATKTSSQPAISEDIKGNRKGVTCGVALRSTDWFERTLGGKTVKVLLKKLAHHSLSAIFCYNSPKWTLNLWAFGANKRLRVPLTCFAILTRLKSDSKVETTVLAFLGKLSVTLKFSSMVTWALPAQSFCRNSLRDSEDGAVLPKHVN